ncbi:MAG TPA: plastocyanin/azurin family copper-binding protein [Candidatus Nitrosopolaris sp.]|nr:plastocyanin/azurin family copper-binding protein [Candidatus Nitrosopolaris sp.]
MTTADEGPIVRTSGKRMLQGMLIIVLVMAVGAAIAIPNWHNFAKNPPPVSVIATESTTAPTAGSTGSAPTTSAVPGVTTVNIVAGASVQGNPNFVPNDAKVPLSNKIVWVNKDTVPHTATSGTSASDPTSGKIFDTKIITNGQSSPPQQLKGVKVGDSIPYYCQIHPYMTAKITVTAALSSSPSTSSNSSNSTGAASGSGAAPALSILQGASTQGNPAYAPATLTVKKGDSIQVTNKDSVPHTVTNGKDASDPTSGKLFDTSIINAGSTAQVSTAKLSPGDYPFHCSLHPYMTGLLKVQ